LVFSIGLQARPQAEGGERTQADASGAGPWLLMTIVSGAASGRRAGPLLWRREEIDPKPNWSLALTLAQGAVLPGDEDKLAART